MCYTLLMKKETIKELGKYLLDISKILIALTLITPLMKDENYSLVAIFLVVIIALSGIYLTNKGVNNE